MWHKNSCICEKLITSKEFITVASRYNRCNNNIKVPIIVLNVYSSCVVNDKIVMWEEITKLKLQETCKQLGILGDLNVIRKTSERKKDKLRDSMKRNEGVY